MTRSLACLLPPGSAEPPTCRCRRPTEDESTTESWDQVSGVATVGCQAVDTWVTRLYAIRMFDPMFTNGAGMNVLGMPIGVVVLGVAILGFVIGIVWIRRITSGDGDGEEHWRFRR